MLTPQPKRKAYRNKKILAAARGEACLVNLPGCTRGGADTQFAHSNSSDDGKGRGIKADDCAGSFACDHCHSVLDGRKPMMVGDGSYGLEYMPASEIEWYHNRGIRRTIRRLFELEVIK